jgi:hypothetical protein
MKITWDEITDCDGYYVNMYDSLNESVFEGYSIAPDVTEFIISEYYIYGNWEKHPAEGEIYTVSIQTILFDDDAEENDYLYSVQEVSVRDTVVTWEFN